MKGRNMNKKTFDELNELVIDWAKARKIIPNAKAETQLLKGISEIGELADAAIKGTTSELKDAVGDTIVCLIIFCALKGIDVKDCLQVAYDEIKDRKGTLLPNGVFVKDE